jgi:hypothetical protein
MQARWRREHAISQALIAEFAKWREDAKNFFALFANLCDPLRSNALLEGCYP